MATPKQTTAALDREITDAARAIANRRIREAATAILQLAYLKAAGLGSAPDRQQETRLALLEATQVLASAGLQAEYPGEVELAATIAGDMRRRLIRTVTPP
jgi:hypothetical protein